MKKNMLNDGENCFLCLLVLILRTHLQSNGSTEGWVALALNEKQLIVWWSDSYFYINARTWRCFEIHEESEIYWWVFPCHCWLWLVHWGDCEAMFFVKLLRNNTDIVICTIQIHVIEIKFHLHLSPSDKEKEKRICRKTVPWSMWWESDVWLALEANLFRSTAINNRW